MESKGLKKLRKYIGVKRYCSNCKCERFTDCTCMKRADPNPNPKPKPTN